MANKIIDINPYQGGKAARSNARYLKHDAYKYLEDYKPLRKPVLKLIAKVSKKIDEFMAEIAKKI